MHVVTAGLDKATNHFYSLLRHTDALAGYAWQQNLSKMYVTEIANTKFLISSQVQIEKKWKK